MSREKKVLQNAACTYIIDFAFEERAVLTEREKKSE